MSAVPWRPLTGVLLLTAAFIVVWIVPLFRPRGELFWGHYRLRDVYLGVPIGLALCCAVLVLAVPRHMRRELALRLATVSVSVLTMLAVCDAGYAFGVRGAWRADFWLDQAHISRRYAQADRELGFVRKPGVSWRGYVPDVDRLVEYRTDENGFRNAPGLRRADAIFIGDSFSEAATVAATDTFVHRVARSTGLRVANLARGAYGPQQELIVLRRHGLSYEPRVVVWQLFEGNDLGDAKTFAEWRRNPESRKASLRERYRHNSLLAEWLTKTGTQPGSAPMATLRHNDGTARRISLRYRDEPDAPASNALGMTETANALDAGYRLCQSQGIQMLVVSIPTMARVMAPNISFDRVEDQRTYLPQRTPDQQDFSATIEALCARIGCSFVDSFAALRQAMVDGNRHLYIPNDEHLDVGGHEVVARLIADWLQSQGMSHLPQ